MLLFVNLVLLIGQLILVGKLLLVLLVSDGGDVINVKKKERNFFEPVRAVYTGSSSRFEAVNCKGRYAFIRLHHYYPQKQP